MSPMNTGFLGVLASCLLMISAVPPAVAESSVKLDTSRARSASPASFKDERDNIIPLSPKAAKLTIVHFWATWCVPCVEELAEVDATQWAYGEKDLKIIAISLDGDGNMEKVKDFMRDHKLVHLKPYLDNNMISYKSAGIKGLPTSLFIDKNGMEVARAEGPLKWTDKEVISFIEKHLK